MTTVTVTAHKWEHGWELWINGEPATQVATLDKAENQVRDYLDTVDPNTDHSTTTITVRPDLGPLADDVAAARTATREATAASINAARQTRDVVHRLREAGLSVTDTAAILGVSRGRISQLANTNRERVA